MTGYLSVMGDLVSERAVVECDTCHRYMARWEYSAHPCEVVQLIAVIPSPENPARLRIEFCGQHVATIHRHPGQRLAWCGVGEKIPTAVYGGLGYTETGRYGPGSVE